MAGARLGWLVTRDADLYTRLASFKDYTTICSSAPSEILSLIGLRNKESIVAKHLARVRRNLAVLDDFFARYAALFEWSRPRAGTIAFRATRQGGRFCALPTAGS
jgi:aspartate/methionine/tyrosine aminotransferase